MMIYSSPAQEIISHPSKRGPPSKPSKLGISQKAQFVTFLKDSFSPILMFSFLR